MLSLRSLQRRRDGVELWAIIPRRLDDDRCYVVHGPGPAAADEQFGDLRDAEDAFHRRLQDRPARRQAG